MRDGENWNLLCRPNTCWRKPLTRLKKVFIPDWMTPRSKANTLKKKHCCTDKWVGLHYSTSSGLGVDNEPLIYLALLWFCPPPTPFTLQLVDGHQHRCGHLFPLIATTGFKVAVSIQRRKDDVFYWATSKMVSPVGDKWSFPKRAVKKVKFMVESQCYWLINTIQLCKRKKTKTLLFNCSSPPHKLSTYFFIFRGTVETNAWLTTRVRIRLQQRINQFCISAQWERTIKWTNYEPMIFNSAGILSILGNAKANGNAKSVSF